MTADLEPPTDPASHEVTTLTQLLSLYGTPPEGAITKEQSKGGEIDRHKDARE